MYRSFSGGSFEIFWSFCFCFVGSIVKVSVAMTAGCPAKQASKIYLRARENKKQRDFDFLSYPSQNNTKIKKRWAISGCVMNCFLALLMGQKWVTVISAAVGTRKPYLREAGHSSCTTVTETTTQPTVCLANCCPLQSNRHNAADSTRPASLLSLFFFPFIARSICISFPLIPQQPERCSASDAARWVRCAMVRISNDEDTPMRPLPTPLRLETSGSMGIPR